MCSVVMIGETSRNSRCVTVSRGLVLMLIERILRFKQFTCPHHELLLLNIFACRQIHRQDASCQYYHLSVLLLKFCAPQYSFDGLVVSLGLCAPVLDGTGLSSHDPHRTTTMFNSRVRNKIYTQVILTITKLSSESKANNPSFGH